MRSIFAPFARTAWHIFNLSKKKWTNGQNHSVFGCLNWDFNANDFSGGNSIHNHVWPLSRLMFIDEHWTISGNKDAFETIKMEQHNALNLRKILKHIINWQNKSKLRKCTKRFLHDWMWKSSVWHLSVQSCEKPLYNGINTNWRWMWWMHSSNTTKAKRVKFNRTECGMEFVSVIRLPLVCVHANSYYLFINIYTSHLSRQHVHMRMTSKNHTPWKCRRASK